MGNAVSGPIQALPVAIAQGGTGAATQTAALTALLGASTVPIANGGTNAATAAAARTSLQVLPSTGAVPASFAPANPAATASATLVMMGLGATCRFSPTVTGTTLVTVTGLATTAVAAVSLTVGGRFGNPASGSPANGVAVTGTAFGAVADLTMTPPGIGLPIPFAVTTVLALSAGTTYWFDLALLTSNVADAASLSDVTMSFLEWP